MTVIGEIDLLRIVLWTQGALLVPLLAALVVRAFWLDRRRLNQERSLASAYAAVSQDLGRSHPREETVHRVRGLDDSTRLRLFEALGRNVSAEWAAVVRELADRLGVLERAHRLTESGRWWTRLQGLRVLSLSASADRETLRRLRTDPHRAVRAEAIGALVDLEPPPVEVIVDALSDQAPICRFAAEQALHRLGGVAIGAVARALDGPPSPATLRLLRVAAANSDSRYVGAALKLTDHGDPRVRAGALRVLGSVGGRDAVASLEHGLADPSPVVRTAAVSGFGTLGRWQAAPEIGAMLRDPAWDVRRAAGDALRHLGAPGHLLLRRALSDPDRFAADMARQVLDHPDYSESVERA